MKIFINIILAVFVSSPLASMGFGGENLTDPYQIFERHYRAIGGLDKLRAEETRYFEGTVVMEGTGLRGTLAQWEHDPLRERSELDLAVFKQTSGDNGQFSWEVDPNGKVHIQRDEATIARRKVEELSERYEHLDPRSPHFTVTFEGTEKVDTVDCFVVKIATSINRDTAIYYVNVNNYYLVKRVERWPDAEFVEQYADYRQVDGIQCPFRREIAILPVGQELTIQLTRYESNIPIDPALFEPPELDVEDFRFVNDEKAEDIPFQFIENHIYLSVLINGEKGLWVLDTGAGTSVVDKGYAVELGLELEGTIKGQGAGNVVEASFATLPPYRIPGVQFDEQKIAAIDIRDLFRKTLGKDVVGILGYDFLSRFVTKVDYAHERLSFYHPEEFVYQGNGIVLDAPLRNHSFTVTMNVDETYSGRWNLDLGAGGEAFHYPFAEDHGLLERKGVERVGFGAGGELRMRTVPFESIQFAGFTIRNPLIDIPLHKGKGAFSGGELVGNIGNALLRHFVLYLDYSSQQVIVERGDDFGRRFPRDGSGLQILLSDDDDVNVYFVSPRMPAAKAGFREGDVITKINDIDVDYFDGIVAIRKLFREEPGARYTISVLRDGKERDLNLTLRDLY